MNFLVVYTYLSRNSIYPLNRPEFYKLSCWCIPVSGLDVFRKPISDVYKEKVNNVEVKENLMLG